MTNFQKQCLLNFLGYDTGGIGNGWGNKSRNATEQCQEDLNIPADGVWGPQTEAAVLEAVYTYDEKEPVPAPDTGDEPQALADLFAGIRYWSPEEFRCRCGEYHEPYCSGFPVLPDRTLLELADDVRDWFDAPAHRSSGIRCPQHNADSKGAAGSRHLTGKALDFFVEGATAAEVLAAVRRDPRARYAYPINDAYVHMDVY